MTTARQEAALRVRSLHPPLDQLFAALRADLGLPPREHPVRPAPPPAPPASGSEAPAPDVATPAAPAPEPPAPEPVAVQPDPAPAAAAADDVPTEAAPPAAGPADAESPAADAEPAAVDAPPAVAPADSEPEPDASEPATTEPEPTEPEPTEPEPTEPEPTASAEEPEPAADAPLPHHPVGPDPLAAALSAVAREGGEDADDLALRFVVATEHVVIAAARAGARAALDAGAPGDGDIDGTPIDAVISLMHPYAAEIAALRGSGVEPPPPDPDLLGRIRAVARSAGVVAAVRGTDWRAIQRFGEPYCPRWGCYGRDGSTLDEARIAEEGLPPYGDGCNCRAEAVPPW